MTELVVLTVLGLCIATIAMAIGIGAGILWTPLFILAYKLSPQEAVATSLMIQMVGTGSGTIAYLRSGLVEKKLVLIFTACALPGVILGGFLSFKLSEDIVQMALGVMAMILAVLFVSTQEEFGASSTYRFDKKKVQRVCAIPGFFGVAMGSLSVGISEWLIPAMRNRLNLEMKKAIATAIPMTFLLASTGALVHWSNTEGLNLKYFIAGGIGTFVGGQIGAHISQRINERLLKQSFIYLMTLIGIHLIFQSI